MAKKLSKSDDPQAVQQISEEVISKHFMLGERVKIQHQPPAEIVDRGPGWIVVEFPDGSTNKLWPMALDYELRN